MGDLSPWLKIKIPSKFSTIKYGEELTIPFVKSGSKFGHQSDQYLDIESNLTRK